MELHWLLQMSVKVNPSFFLPRSLPIFSYVSLKSLELSLFFLFFFFFSVRLLFETFAILDSTKTLPLAVRFFRLRGSRFCFFRGNKTLTGDTIFVFLSTRNFLRERETRLDRKFPSFCAKSSRDTKLVLDCFVLAVRLLLPRRLRFSLRLLLIGRRVCVKVFHEIVSRVYILDYSSIRTIIIRVTFIVCLLFSSFRIVLRRI